MKLTTASIAVLLHVSAIALVNGAKMPKRALRDSRPRMLSKGSKSSKSCHYKYGCKECDGPGEFESCFGAAIGNTLDKIFDCDPVKERETMMKDFGLSSGMKVVEAETGFPLEMVEPARDTCEGFLGGLMGYKAISLDFDLSGDGSGCMSGDLLIQRPGNLTDIALKDLQRGDEVLGFDESFTNTTCEIITVGEWSTGMLFDQYTANHLIYNAEDGNIQQHGSDGIVTFEDMFIPISTCPLILDSAGTAFTSLDGYALGDDNPGPFSLPEYMNMWTVQKAFVQIVPEIMSEAAYNFTRAGASESLGFYSTIQATFACSTDSSACIGAFAALKASLLRYNDEIIATVAPIFAAVNENDPVAIQTFLNALLSP